MGALLDNFSFVYHVNAGGVAIGGKAMGDSLSERLRQRNRRPVLRNLSQRLLNGSFSLIVHR